MQDADTTIWLLGTIHVLPPEVRWETPAIKAAIDGADMLVTEIPAQDSGATLTEVPGLPPLARRVPSDRREALKAAIEKTDKSMADADRMPSWAAATLIANNSVRAAGAKRIDGVEAVLAQRFDGAGRPHIALETLSAQLAMFGTLPEEAQRLLLLRAIDGRDDYRTMLSAWATGNEKRLAASFEDSFREMPMLLDTLVTRRNARWSGWIARRMHTPGKVLVAVGAGHLVGDRSVVAMLRARGLKVDRVQ